VEEIVEAVRHHFPVMVQRAMISTHPRTVEETLDLLKRVEMLGGDEPYQRSDPVPHHPNSTPNRDQHNRGWGGGDGRGRPNQHYSRRVQCDRRKTMVAAIIGGDLRIVGDSTTFRGIASRSMTARRRVSL
jgi:hypothetical protein